MSVRVAIFTKTFNRLPVAYLEAIYREGRRRGWNMVTVEMTDGGYKIPGMTRVLNAGELARTHPVDGLISVDRNRPPNHPHFQRIPMVCLTEERCASRHGVNIECDHASICEMAYGEFVRVGCRDFAFVGWPEKRLWSIRREKAFAVTVRRHGGILHGVRPNRLDDDLARLPRKCGVLAVNDFVALTVEQAAERIGKNIPYDFVLIGVDNDPFLCETAAIPVTSIEQDYAGHGKCAVETLECLLSGSGADTVAHPMSAHTLVRRASSCVLPRVNSKVGEALEFIRREVSKALTPDMVADGMGISRNLADLYFKRATGRTLHDAILAARIEKAKELLLRPSQSLSAVYAFCGFASAADFRRVFKRIVGVTPHEWRRRV